MAVFLVPETGLEPVRCCHRGILSPLRLPISPLRQVLEAPPRFGLGVKVLQTRALPLGYGALFIKLPLIKKWSGKRDSNSRHLPWQGNALPLSHSRIKLLRWDVGGNNRARTYDPLLVRQMLSQLSYAPYCFFASHFRRRCSFYHIHS